MVILRRSFVDLRWSEFPAIWWLFCSFSVSIRSSAYQYAHSAYQYVHPMRPFSVSVRSSAYQYAHSAYQYAHPMRSFSVPIRSSTYQYAHQRLCDVGVVDTPTASCDVDVVDTPPQRINTLHSVSTRSTAYSYAPQRIHTLTQRYGDASVMATP